jgi:hypothetical protein
MSDFFGKLKSGTEKVAFEADKMMRLNKAKGELERVKSLIQGQYAKLGEMYYTQRATSGVTGTAFDEICQAIVDLGHQVEAKNAEVQKINADVYGPQGAQPAAAQTPPPAPPVQVPPSVQAPTFQTATKFCPNCGKELAVTVKFCPDCGKSV